MTGDLRTERISLYLTKGEKGEIEAYCREKKRWKRPSDLGRDAIYQLMARNPIHRRKGDTDDG